MSKRRSFTIDQKLTVIREGQEYGMLVTCRKHAIAQSLYYRWKRQFENKGIDGLQPSYYKIDPEVRELERENERLKRIIAKQALELEVKSELLKKTEHYRKFRGK